jgi:hypothetical protein
MIYYPLIIPAVLLGALLLLLRTACTSLGDNLLYWFDLLYAKMWTYSDPS